MTADPIRPGAQLCELLLRYLQESRVNCWPGVDGLTEGDVLECYPTACALGQVPGCHELCTRHPAGDSLGRRDRADSVVAAGEYEHRPLDTVKVILDVDVAVVVGYEVA